MKFSLSGNWKPTQLLLRQKGLRAYFGLKSYIDITSISKTAMFKLFDALILPVVSYGHQIWLPFTDALKEISLTTSAPATNGQTSTLQKFVNDPIEGLYLSVLRWTFGLPK